MRALTPGMHTDRMRSDGSRSSFDSPLSAVAAEVRVAITMAHPEILAGSLKRSFGTTQAVNGVDLSVDRGDIYRFLGPNGEGKSTVARGLCALVAPTGGQATVAGFDVAADPEQVRIRRGAALQEAALDAKQTGSEMLRLQGRFYGLSKADTKRRLADLRTLIDIGPALHAA